MKYGIFSIYDSAAGVFTAPTIDVTDASAIRNFAQALNNSGSTMNFKPSDFALYRIGTFAVESGLVEADTPPVHLVSGDRCVKVVLADDV